MLSFGCPEASDTEHLWLCGLYVKPEKRHQGLALLLAQAALRQLIRLKILTVYLYTALPELDQLYEQYGFAVKREIQVEGYPAKVREGVVQEVLEHLEQRLCSKQASLDTRRQGVSP